jgi:hypothetical protein
MVLVEAVDLAVAALRLALLVLAHQVKVTMVVQVVLEAAVVVVVQVAQVVVLLTQKAVVMAVLVLHRHILVHQ